MGSALRERARRSGGREDQIANRRELLLQRRSRATCLNAYFFPDWPGRRRSLCDPARDLWQRTSRTTVLELSFRLSEVSAAPDSEFFPPAVSLLYPPFGLELGLRFFL